MTRTEPNTYLIHSVKENITQTLVNDGKAHSTQRYYYNEVCGNRYTRYNRIQGQVEIHRVGWRSGILLAGNIWIKGAFLAELA